MAASFPTGRIKRGRASLVGGVAVGVCVLALWLGIAHEVGLESLTAVVLGVLVAGVVGSWIRIADL
ncbi:MAG: hypothetical protein ACREPS_11390 [Rhodanobacteraceae bacterium]